MFGRTPKEKEERRRLPLWYRAVSFSVTLLAVAAVCFCGVLAIIARMGEEGKSVFGTVILRVESESMEPTFLAGDVLAFSEYDGGELSEGDIVVFRAPYGDYSDKLMTKVEELGMVGVQWSIDSLDWKGLSAKEIVDRVVPSAESGDIVLFHNNSDHILDALPLVLMGLKNKGFTFVGLHELVATENFTVDAAGVQHKTV